MCYRFVESMGGGRCVAVWVEDEKIELDRREYVMSNKARERD